MNIWKMVCGKNANNNGVHHMYQKLTQAPPTLKQIEDVVSTYNGGGTLDELMDSIFGINDAYNLQSWLYHVLCSDLLLQRGNIIEHEVALNLPSSVSLLQCKKRLKEICDEGPQRVCSVAFRPGDIVWNCKQCQKDPTCVLCQKCFQNSDHVGHDVFFYHVINEGGGCCDCGDPGAWDPKGFCDRHRHKPENDDELMDGSSEDPSLCLPTELRRRAALVMDKCVEYITKVSEMEPTVLVLCENDDNEKVAVNINDKEYLPNNIYALCNQLLMRSQTRMLRTMSREQHRQEIRNWVTQAILRRETKLRNSGNFVSQPKNEPTDSGPEHGLNLSAISAKALKYNRVHFGKTRFQRGNFDRIWYHFFPEDVKPKKTWKTFDPLPLVFVCGTDMHAISSFMNEIPSASVVRAEIINPEAQQATETARVVLKWLLDVCQDSDGLTRILADSLCRKRKSNDKVKGTCTAEQTYLERLMLRDVLLPSYFNVPLHEVYIRLLVDSSFKQRYAVTFAKTYKGIYDAYLCDSPRLQMDETDNMIFGLSVQFLNRAVFVELLVHQHAMIRSMIRSLHMMIKAAADGKPQVNLRSPVALERKYSNISTDLRYVLQVPGMAYHLCFHRAELLELWFEILTLNQLVDSQERCKADHIEFESQTWMSAFNLNLNLGNLFTYIVQWMFEIPMESSFDAPKVSLLEGKTSYGELCTKMVTLSAKALSAWLEKYFPAQMCLQEHNSLLGRAIPVFRWDLFSLPVSFHLPLHRFFSFTMRSSIISTLDPMDYQQLLGGGSTEFWLGVMRFPLNALILSAQIDAGLWRRNGESMDQQSVNYKLVPLCFHTRDIDYASLQLVAMHVPIEVFFANIVTAFDLMPWFDFLPGTENGDLKAGGGKSSRLSEGKYVQMAESFLFTLSTIITEVPLPSKSAWSRVGKNGSTKPIILGLPSSQEQIYCSDEEFRIGVIHRLATKPCTFSALSDSCSLSYTETSSSKAHEVELKRVLDEVAKVRENTKPKTFDLLQPFWREYNPFYYGLQAEDREKSRERWLEMLRSKPVREVARKPCFPGDSKPKAKGVSNKSTQRYEPIPSIGSLSLAHPAFESLRCKLMLSHTMFSILRTSLNKCVNELNMPLVDTIYEETNNGMSSFVEPYVKVSESKSPSLSGVLSLTLQLLTLQVHLLERLNIFGQSGEGKGQTAEFCEIYRSPQLKKFEWPTPCQPRHRKSGSWASTIVKDADSFVEELLSSNLMSVDKDSTPKRCILICLINLCNAYTCNRTTDAASTLIDDGIHEGIRWLLSKYSKSSARCSQVLRDVLTRRKNQNGSPVESDVSVLGLSKKAQKLSRKRKAKAQKRAMAKMKAHQIQAMKALEDQSSPGLNSEVADLSRWPASKSNPDVTSSSTVDMDIQTYGVAEESTTTKDKVSELFCVTCREGEIGRPDGHDNAMEGSGDMNLLWIGMVQHNEVIQTDRVVSRCVHWNSSNKGEIRLCGHAIHAKCLSDYKCTLESGHDANMMNCVDIGRCEFLCPFCKTISNVAIPVHNHALSGNLACKMPSTNESSLRFTNSRADINTIVGLLKSLDSYVQSPHIRIVQEDWVAYTEFAFTVQKLSNVKPNIMDAAASHVSISITNLVNSTIQRANIIRHYNSKPTIQQHMLRDREIDSDTLSRLDGLHPAVEKGKSEESESCCGQVVPPCLRLGETLVSDLIRSVAFTLISTRASMNALGQTKLSAKSLSHRMSVFKAVKSCVLNEPNYSERVIRDIHELLNIRNGKGGYMMMSRSSLFSNDTYTLACSPELLFVVLVLTSANSIDISTSKQKEEKAAATDEGDKSSHRQQDLLSMFRVLQLLCLTQCLYDICQNGYIPKHGERNKCEVSGLFGSPDSLKELAGVLLSEIQPWPASNEITNLDGQWITEHIECEMLKYAQTTWIVFQMLEDQAKCHSESDNATNVVMPQNLSESSIRNWFSFNADDILGNSDIIHLMKTWCKVYFKRPHTWFSNTDNDDVEALEDLPVSGFQVDSEEMRQARKVRSEVGPLCCRPLVRLEKSYTELYSRHYQGNCETCDKPKHDRAICLLCGQSLLAGLHDRKPVRHLYPPINYWGECTTHTMKHHAGVGMVFLLNRPSIVLIKGLQSVYWRSIYTDQHGEDQRAVGRALPMFFDEERFQEAEKIWTENRIVKEVVTKRNKDTSSIIGAFF